ncbi:hypothetical protein GOARA_088_00680 [Gordonia araii NBRC 100433]|uniref:Uncharacterized protein n=1 Tax=Gordonia araii NBRC 100433 TaxID=1073574 RepID=G7H7H9_9ACTN|nr:hypothetical protein [Gordonia araii]NNG98487.1 hypothetical protein [Gordonia araii NBRC 100433]GAB11804.1 hypothetical protein GOARA_088_00680 [Gordonia araii NBRC 100433]
MSDDEIRPDDAEFEDAAIDEPAADEADESAAAEDEKPAVKPGEKAESTRGASATFGNRSLALASLVAIVGLVVGVIGVVVGYRAYHDGRTENVRDAVLATAETAAMNVTTIDPRNPDKFKENVESVLTGRALQELRGKGFEEVLSRKDAPGRLEGRVRRSAVTEVNRGERAGKALVYVDVVAKAPNQPNVNQTMGFLISVRNIDGNYMADSIAAFNPISYADQRANQRGAQQNQNPNQQNPGQQGGGN